MNLPLAFPTLRARDLERRDVELPTAFVGERNIVVIAFRRQHQVLVDSWLPWFEDQVAIDPALRFYEVPTIGRLWAPVRPLIDGGMAAAIRDPVVLRRTFTIYGDVGRVTGPLGIRDRSTVTVCVVDRPGTVLGHCTGGRTLQRAGELEAVLAAHRPL